MGTFCAFLLLIFCAIGIGVVTAVVFFLLGATSSVLTGVAIALITIVVTLALMLGVVKK